MATEIVNITVEEQDSETFEIAVTEVNGQDGYTPIKGVDYFDGQDGYTPVFGVDYHNGAPGSTESQQSILLKLGAATDMSDGFLSHADHIIFKNKQPAGAYILNTNIVRGTKVYHSQGSGDTIGDWRTYSDSAGFYTQYCTVGAATRGFGTWATKQVITI